jgi:hypothetical protein
MLKHTLLLIYRNFRRYRSTFFINLLGLSSGLACTLLIYLWVNDELHVDKFHEKEGRLYQVLENWQEEWGLNTKGDTPHQLAGALAAEMPEVEYAVPMTPPHFFPKMTLTYGGNNIRATGRFAGKDYFHVFSFPLTQGHKNQVLADRNGIVLSEALAARLFKTARNAIGKPVTCEAMGVTIQATVSGVFAGVPANSSEAFDFLLPFDKFITDIMHMEVDWGRPEPFHTYAALKPGTDPDAFNRRLAGFLRQRSPKAAHRTLFATPYSDQYLYGKFENGKPVGTRIVYVQLFAAIAGFILLIACINFTNLSTARASRRLKEVGIKKVVGAGRSTLVAQYLGESLLMAFLALGLAVGAVALLLPQFNQVTGKLLALDVSANVVLAFLGITAFTGLAAGSYPALYLSGFKPALVLKGKFNAATGELWARKGLVVFQFTLSVVFTVLVLVVYRQIAYVQHKNLGYDKDHLIAFETEGRVTERTETFLAEIKKIPGVVNASSKLGDFLGKSGQMSTWLVGEKQVLVNNMRVNYDMIETLGVPVQAGRSFSRAFGTDLGKQVVNEAFVKALGLQDPVGKTVEGGNGLRIRIIGVVGDFHYQSLHEVIQPLVFTLEPETVTTALVRLQAGRERETLQRLEAFYKEFNPGFAFNYQFVDQAYQAQYVAEERVSVLSGYAAVLAVLISCLGLLGLAAFSAERRRKEIGVRKVLGATESGIVALLSGEFAQLVGIAVVLGLPTGFFIARAWLAGFAYRIELEAWYFVLAGGLALVTALLTVSTQAFRAARVNPVHCLKEE